MNTSKRLDELLKQRKMSLKELSRRSGVSYSTLYSARQRDGQLSVDTIELLCKELGIRPFEFYMTDEDLVIFFPPYVLSYYAKGFIEFPLRLTELNGYLNEEFRVEQKNGTAV